MKPKFENAISNFLDMSSLIMGRRVVSDKVKKMTNFT